MLVLFSVPLFCQDYPITDRSFAYVTAATLDKSKGQIEYGYFQLHDLALSQLDLAGNTVLIRYGLLKSVELRARIGHRKFYIQESDISNVLSEVAPVQLSTKISLIPEGRYMPAISTLLEFDLPAAQSEGFRPNELNVTGRIIAEKYINDIFIVGANLGYTKGDGELSSLNYSLSTRIAVKDEIALYLEFFGNDFNLDIPTTNYAGGALEFWLLDDLALDFAYGWGVSEIRDRNYWSVGLAFLMD